MTGSEFCGFSFWWIFPVIMIVFCFFMMRGRKVRSICGFGSRREERTIIDASDSPADILDKRYALGEISEEEYEMRKRTLNH
jgi:uncharacterized membrane protein